MKTKLVSLIILSFLTISLISCDKDDDPVTKKELLTKKEWQLYKSERYDINDELLETSQEDLYFLFTSDHKYIIKENDNQILEEGEWDMNSEETKLYFIDPYNNRAYVFIIIKLEENEMIIKENILYPAKEKISTYEVFYFKR